MSLADSAEKFMGKKVLVIGDLMLDKYIKGSTQRKSPEAPVFILDYKSESNVLGGAANVANNLRHLGGDVKLCGVIGNGESKRLFLELLDHEGISHEGVFTDESRPMTVKTRFISNDSDHVEHQMLRLDVESREKVSDEMNSRIIAYLEKIIPHIDIVAISDYNKGVFSKRLGEEITRLCRANDRRLIVAPKPENFSYFRGCTLVLPNRLEANKITNIADDLGQMSKKIIEMADSEQVLITCGKEGMFIYNKDSTSFFSKATAKSVANIVGAGDTVLATITLALAAGIDLREAADIANKAAGIAVTKPGTVAVSLAELLEELRK